MSINKVLLLIDLQTGFSSSANDPTVIKIVNIEIEKAKKEDIPIISLMFTGHGEVISPIKSNLDGYHKLHYVEKSTDCGGREVDKQLQTLGFNNCHIFVCGVNTGACVRATIETLCKCNPNYVINVIANGCNGHCYDAHCAEINEFIAMRKFKIYHTIDRKPYKRVVITAIKKSKRLCFKKCGQKTILRGNTLMLV